MALFSALLIVVVAICLASITVCALAVSIGGSRVTDIDQYCESYYSMHNQNERYSNLTYVKKTQLKNGTNATFVFIAGLGGTGHHLFAQVMDSISKNQSINKNHYDASMIRLQLWNSKSHGLFTFNDVTNLCSSMNSVVRGYHYYMQHATRKSYYMLNGLSQNERTGFLSYPNRYPDDLPYEPDLNVLAALAEMSHADLRILVLLRHPVNSVISILKSYYGSNKKSHNSIEHYVDVFAKSQHYLLLQLIATDPGNSYIHKCLWRFIDDTALYLITICTLPYL